MTETIRHHLSDDVLLAYSAGSLPEAFNLMAAAHLSLCDSCRAQAESFDAVGGEVLDAGAGADARTDAGSLAATFAKIDGMPIDTAPVTRRKSGVLPGPLQDYVGGDLESVRWKSMGMGIRQAILPTARGATARLLSIPAGMAMPDHGHHGTEMTMVLKGAFQDADEYFARGDVDIAGTDTQHTPVADIHEDCICLAVTDAPLRFEGLLPRIAQRFLGI